MSRLEPMFQAVSKQSAAQLQEEFVKRFNAVRKFTKDSGLNEADSMGMIRSLTVLPFVICLQEVDSAIFNIFDAMQKGDAQIADYYTGSLKEVYDAMILDGELVAKAKDYVFNADQPEKLDLFFFVAIASHLQDSGKDFDPAREQAIDNVFDTLKMPPEYERIVKPKPAPKSTTSSSGTSRSRTTGTATGVAAGAAAAHAATRRPATGGVTRTGGVAASRPAPSSAVTRTGGIAASRPAPSSAVTRTGGVTASRPTTTSSSGGYRPTPAPSSSSYSSSSRPSSSSSRSASSEDGSAIVGVILVLFLFWIGLVVALVMRKPRTKKAAIITFFVELGSIILISFLGTRLTR